MAFMASKRGSNVQVGRAPELKLLPGPEEASHQHELPQMIGIVICHEQRLT
jgi:hypothetical protein